VLSGTKKDNQPITVVVFIEKKHLAMTMVVVASVALPQKQKSIINLTVAVYGNLPALVCKK